MTYGRSNMPWPAVRALVDRWYRDGMPPVRILAGEPLHERGRRLSCDEWSAVIFVPFVCEALGEEQPAWADLGVYAAMVCRILPLVLLDVLLAAYRNRAGAVCDPGGAALGVALDLCVTSPHVGPEAWISITPFGHAVALVYLMERTARGVERGNG